MRHLCLGICVLALGGCATPSEIERRAEQHDRRADRLASVREYERAAAEQEEADRLHEKAQRRSYEMGAQPPVR